jgi:deoxyhypusine synthase
VGGAVPKNFIQQTEVTASIMGIQVPGHKYAIQVITDPPHWGGLSGCTFEEAQSWGKIAAEASKVTVYSDATIALPLIVTALATRRRDNIKKRRLPKFEMSNTLRVSF